jgi:hypothetical protein
MRLILEATDAELEASPEALAHGLAKSLAADLPGLSSLLEKAATEASEDAVVMPRDPAMRDLFARTRDLYATTLKDMVAEVAAMLEEESGAGRSP